MRLLWDLIKFRIRLFYISYSKIKSKEFRDEEQELKLKIEELDKEVSKTNSENTYR